AEDGIRYFHVTGVQTCALPIAAYKMDTVGVFGAMSEISQIKVVAPGMAQTIIDQAIQIHGGAGMSNDFPLTALFGYARVLRMADGPDEVHRGLIAKLELKKYEKLKKG